MPSYYYLFQRAWLEFKDLNLPSFYREGYVHFHMQKYIHICTHTSVYMIEVYGEEEWQEQQGQVGGAWNTLDQLLLDTPQKSHTPSATRSSFLCCLMWQDEPQQPCEALVQPLLASQGQTHKDMPTGEDPWVRKPCGNVRQRGLVGCQ